MKSYMTEKFKDFLIASGFVRKDDAGRIFMGQKTNEEIEDLLLKSGLLTSRDLLEAKSKFLGIEKISLEEETFEHRAVKLVSEQFAGRYGVIPIRFKGNKLLVAAVDPTNLQVLDSLRMISGHQVEGVLADSEEIKAAIRQYLTLGKITDEQKEELPWHEGVWSLKETEDSSSSAVTRVVNSLLSQAVSEQASDIHWEPIEEKMKVRFRLDGLLHLKASLPKEIAGTVTSRLKVMSGLDVAERRLPQDGRMVLAVNSQRIDVRVSTYPTIYGEKTVTRILDTEQARYSLIDLGMRKDLMAEISLLLKQPHGLILVSGPTGSGKTTTLYAFLREINTDCLNAVSIEDPVEYRLPGVNQAQVYPKIGFTFANGLRSVLRQDPDVIMVGEIRDSETAKIAVAAALTGHLVLSTLHTNTAAESITRLMEMDIEPYLVASALCGVIAQRLVRKLCPYCKKEYDLTTEIKEMLLNQSCDRLYLPAGCSKCRGTGYLGRIGVHEYISYNPYLKNLIMENKNASDIERDAKKRGMKSLFEDALGKAEAGITSLEEVFRVTAGF